jgi:hypothetical protein
VGEELAATEVADQGKAAQVGGKQGKVLKRGEISK